MFRQTNALLVPYSRDVARQEGVGAGDCRSGYANALCCSTASTITCETGSHGVRPRLGIFKVKVVSDSRAHKL